MASHGEHEQATHKQQVSKVLSHLSNFTRWLIWNLTMAYHKPRHIVSYAWVAESPGLNPKQQKVFFSLNEP